MKSLRSERFLFPVIKLKTVEDPGKGAVQERKKSNLCT